jgi:hypothetical protein
MLPANSVKGRLTDTFLAHVIQTEVKPANAVAGLGMGRRICSSIPLPKHSPAKSLLNYS